MRLERLKKISKKHNSFLKFGLIGTIGTIINTAILTILTNYAGIFYLFSSIIATETAIISNFFGNHFFTFKGNKDPSPVKKKFLKFQIISVTTIIGTVFLLWIFIDVLNFKYLVIANIVAIFIMFTANFFLNTKFTWRKTATSKKINPIIIISVFIFLIFPIINAANNTTLPDLPQIPGESNQNNNETNSTNETEPPINETNNETIPPGNETEIPENETSPSIISYYTNLSPTENNGSKTYFMYETETAYFNITLNGSEKVEWKVNEKIVSETSENHEFEWNPGILYSGEKKLNSANVSATSGNETIVWEIEVRDVINPFFSPPPPGDGNTFLNIFTYDIYETYNNVSVKITNPSLTSTTFYNLESYEAGNNETEWKKQFSFEESYTHHLIEIELVKENETTKYNFDLDKFGYYKNPPPANSEDGSGGSGSSSSPGSDRVDLIYVILDKEILLINETQKITLDAEARRGVTKTTAIFSAPDGEKISVELKLTEGSRSYGTWTASMDSLKSGLYKLIYVDLTGQTLRSYKRFEIDAREFYVISNDISQNEQLAVIYTALEKSEVSKPENITLKLDARDFQGIEEVKAFMEKTRGEIVLGNFTIYLSLTEGNKKYGTWEGAINVDEGDVTYHVREITLKNPDNESVYKIENRSVYATSDIPVKYYRQESPGILGFVTGLSILNSDIKKPSFPAIIGTGIFLVAVTLSLTFRKIKKLLKKEEPNGN